MARPKAKTCKVCGSPNVMHHRRMCARCYKDMQLGYYYKKLENAPIEPKICKACEQELPLESFPINKSYKDGRATTCKKCKSEEDYRRNHGIKGNGEEAMRVVPVDSRLFLARGYSLDEVRRLAGGEARAY